MANPLAYDIHTIYLGFRYKNFKISDISGQIIDDILYAKDTPFGTDFFPSVTSGVDDKILQNDQTGNYISINPSDFILKLSVDKINTSYENLTEKYYPFLLEIFRKHKLCNIRRIGIQYRHEMVANSSLNELVKSFTNNTVEEPNDVRVSFSKVYRTADGYIKKGLEDYITTIFNVTKHENKIIAELDYQKYLEPIAEDIDSCEPREFIANSKNFLQSKFYTWLKKYIDEER